MCAKIGGNHTVTVATKVHQGQLKNGVNRI